MLIDLRDKNLKSDAKETDKKKRVDTRISVCENDKTKDTGRKGVNLSASNSCGDDNKERNNPTNPMVESSKVD